MKKINKAMLLSMVLMAIPVAVHADEVGNGGDVVVCRNETNEITSIELLDFYEGKGRDIQPDLGDASLSVSDKIQIALQRLERLDPFRFNLYKTGAQEFEQKSDFRYNEELVDIPDSQHLKFPKNCKVEQIVIRVDKKNRFPEDNYWLPEGKKYIVDGNLWNNPLFGNTDKAGLILHEQIYEDSQHPSSRWSRYFNSYLTSHKIESLSFRDYLQFLKENIFVYYAYHNLFFYTEGLLLFDHSDQIKSGVLMTGEFTFRGEKATINQRSSVELYENGNLHFVWTGLHPNFIPLFGRQVQLAIDNSLQFYENGNPSYIEIAYYYNVDDNSYPLMGIYISTNRGHTHHADRLVFNEDGTIKIARIVSRKWFEDWHTSDYYSHYDFVPVDPSLSEQVDQTIHRLYPISLKLEQDENSYDIPMPNDAGQIILIGEAFNALSESEQSKLKEKLKKIYISQDSINLFVLHFCQNPSISRGDAKNELCVTFDNNSGEREFVSKEKILEEFGKIIKED